MRWIARRKAAWAVSAWLVAMGIGSAQEPPTGPALPEVKVEVLPPVLLRPEPESTLPAAPETGFATQRTRIIRTPYIAVGEAIPVMRVPVAGISVFIQTAGSPPPGAQPGPAPREIENPALMPLVNQPLVIAPVANENPWANVPSVQVLPRLGYFLVPGSGPGYYSALDKIQGNYREKPPVFPYPPFALQPPSGFDADYRYLDKPDNTQHDFFDHVKRMHPTPDTMITIGGQDSIRYMNEVDSRLGRTDNTYTLMRNRIWADMWYTPNYRLYAEMINAVSVWQDLPPSPIDVNRAGVLNLFGEARVCDIAGSSAWLRVGRQELLFGSQRLVTTLDWANTRRTFEGVRGYWRTENLDVDLFWTHPVTIRPTETDQLSAGRQFYGAWTTYRPAKGLFFDAYYLGYTDTTGTRDRFIAGARAPIGIQDVHTFGARSAGNQGSFLWDVEGMVQKGRYVERDHHAYAYTLSAGWEFKDHPWRPQVWAGYDYASGTENPAPGNDNQTFNQLFAFGHYYFGYLDLVGRQNIQDFNLQVAAYPHHWITLVAQVHQFRLAQERDFLYNAAGRPTRRDATGAAGDFVGTEIDFLANFHLTAHQDILVGYSKLYSGSFIRNTGADVSPELFYLMYNFRW